MGGGDAMQFLYYLICVFSALLRALSARDTGINEYHYREKSCADMFFIASALKSIRGPHVSILVKING